MGASLRIRPAAVLLAMVAILAMPVSSMAGIDGADYVVWRLPTPGARGLGMMHLRASDTTLLVETVGLTPHSTYHYVGSRVGCGSSHTASQIVWAITFQSNAKGAALIDTSRTGNVLTALRSIRLFRGSTQSECASPVRYSSQGSGGQPTDAFARLSAFGAKALVFVDLGSPNDRITAVGHGFIASHGYRLVAADVACPTQPTGSVLFQKSGNTNSLGILWRHDAGSNLAAKPPRSIQLFNPSNDRVACATTTRLPAIP